MKWFVYNSKTQTKIYKLGLNLTRYVARFKDYFYLFFVSILFLIQCNNSILQSGVSRYVYISFKTTSFHFKISFSLIWLHSSIPLQNKRAIFLSFSFVSKNLQLNEYFANWHDLNFKVSDIKEMAQRRVRIALPIGPTFIKLMQTARRNNKVAIVVRQLRFIELDMKGDYGAYTGVSGTFILWLFYHRGYDCAVEMILKKCFSYLNMTFRWYDRHTDITIHKNIAHVISCM